MSIYYVKVKEVPYLIWALRPQLIPASRLSALKWPVINPGCHYCWSRPTFSARAAAPLSQYQIIMFGDWGTCVKTCPESLHESEISGTCIYDLLTVCPTPLQLHHHATLHMMNADNWQCSIYITHTMQHTIYYATHHTWYSSIFFSPAAKNGLNASMYFKKFSLSTIASTQEYR